MEGDPFFEPAGGLEFLFGVLCARPDGEPTTRPIRARDRAGERQAFEQFIDLVHARLAEHPDMHVYHYAAYEPSTLARLMGAHATREAEVDDLLRREVLVDLSRSSARACAPASARYSLKEIEQFFFTRTADVQLGQRRRDRASSATSTTATRRCSTTSRPTTRRTASRRSSCATGCSSSGDEAEAEFGVEIPFRMPPEQREGTKEPPRSSRRRPASGRPARGGGGGATSAGSRRSSSTTTAARRARAGGGTSAGSR